MLLSFLLVSVESEQRDTSHACVLMFPRIESIDLEDDHPKSAVITFERPSAAKTALMLDGGTLDGVTLRVTSDAEHIDHTEQQDHHGTPGHIDQSDKPRAGIAAEYLAKGYKLHDHILQRAIEIDNKQGISKKFLSYIQGLDTSLGQRALGPEQTISSKVQSTFYQARDRAKSIDEQKGLSKVAHEYYSKALSSPFGQRVYSFYTTTSKQVKDIHEEARRIVDQHKESAGATQSSPLQPAASSGDAPTGGSDAQPK
ncbi:hypothetical protein ID866_2232, partial [Astraeus odoratus]